MRPSGQSRGTGFKGQVVQGGRVLQPPVPWEGIALMKEDTKKNTVITVLNGVVAE